MSKTRKSVHFGDQTPGMGSLLVVTGPPGSGKSTVSLLAQQAGPSAAAARKMHEEFARATVDARHVLTIGSESVVEVVDRISAAREAGQLTYALANG